MIVPEDRRQIHHVAMAVLVFLAFSLIFSMAREPIGALNAWILAVSGEIKAGDDAEVANSSLPSLPGTNASGSGATLATAKPSPPPIDMLKPVLSELPKTPPVHVVLLDRLPSTGRDPRLVPAPPLRDYTGFPWDGEKTDLCFASDGTTLYVAVYCHDRKPADLCTEFTEKQGASAAWMDDSIELFLMRDRAAGHYCQYVVSASGMGVTFYLETTPQPHNGRRIEPLPAGFRLPHLEGSVRADGYVVIMEIPLVNLGLERATPGSEILCQVVRNYRGYQKPGEVNLQLFPSHIYGDNRLPELNHHRNAFQPIRFITPQEAAKLPPPPPDDFADVAWE